MSEIKAGDEVRVFEGGGHSRGQPEGGWLGEVVKVGRKLITIRFAPTGREEVFRLDTQHLNDAGFAYRYRFATLEQADLDARRDAAKAVLYAHGIELSHHRSFTLGQIEALAEVAKTFTEEG